ncbi:3-ketoacyl-CoA thiolase [Paraburkholderia sediminicola]|uniref:3-ketoacyl-CoA thiolase n=1 Tax=Paraburkholderia sediminicola TaxID=458836 RepID=A0A6J5CUG8_9BURK|nr:thiolase family protein [Paraburkholderia sediminicola]CAB3745552.1 3-ketoacyl-CoA thiolase [Paraburkholderia sediminicola]
MNEALIAGVGMARFANHGPGVGIKLAREAALAALEDASLTYADIDAVVVGAAHPLSPRGIYVAKDLGLTGVPVDHVTNASATGLTAVHSARQTIRSGDARRVLVIGMDSPQKAVSVEDIIVSEGNFPPVVSFALWAKRRMYERGTTREQLAAIAAKNWNYARSNPYAARQSAAEVTIDRVLGSRIVADPFTSMMCTPWGEGAAAAVLCSDDAWPETSLHPRIRLASSAFGSDSYSRELILEGAIVGPPELSRTTAAKALRQAGLEARDVDVVQVHDAFAVEEFIYYELLGFSKPGQTESLVEEGAFGPGSRQRFGLPEFSTDGGLLARGHPGGPTGLAQIWETVRRLRGSDRVGMCHLLGSGSVCLVQMLVRE